MIGRFQGKYQLDLLFLVDRRRGSSKRFQAHCKLPQPQKPFLSPCLLRFPEIVVISSTNTLLPSLALRRIEVLSRLQTLGHFQVFCHQNETVLG